MKRLIDNIYFRDLWIRQNCPITQAQIHNYIHAKRYSNEDIGRCIKEMKEKKQLDLSGNHVKELNITASNCQEEYEKALEEKFIEKYFVYKNKLVMIDDEKHMLNIRYKSDLFDEFVEEFKKLYAWLDNRGAYLKFIGDDDKEYIIDRSEIANAIHFFDKLNKMKKE